MAYIPTNNFYGIPIALMKNTTYYSNPFFYATLPNSVRDYYIRVVKSSLEWYDGYVWGFHNSDMGCISTKLCRAIIGGVANSVVGSKLLFQTKSGTQESPTLDYISHEWADKAKLTKNVKSAIEMSFCGGKTCVKINQDYNGELWTESVRQDCFFYKTDFKGECIDAKFFIRSFTNTDSNEQFYLYEHRFFTRLDKMAIVKKKMAKEEQDKTVIYKDRQLVPVVVYQVFSYKGTGLINTMSKANGDTSVLCREWVYKENDRNFNLGIKGENGTYNGIDWQQLPEWVRESIKQNYGVDFKIGEMKLLPFHNFNNKLGIYLFSNGKDNSMTTADVGRSLVNDLNAEWLTYDLDWTYLNRDMYLGKGTALLPKQMTAPTIVSDGEGHDVDIPSSNLAGTMDRATYEMYDSANPDTDKPFVIQNQMRGEEHARILDNVFKRIASKLGCSPKRIASWIQQSQSATASEINADDDLDVAFIENMRANYEDSVNELLEDVCRYFAKDNEIVKVKWYSPTALNKDRIQRRLMEQYQQGLIDTEFIIRELYPDYDDTQIRELVKRAKDRQAELDRQKQVFVDQQGNYGDTADDNYIAELDQPNIQTPNSPEHEVADGKDTENDTDTTY